MMNKAKLWRAAQMLLVLLVAFGLPFYNSLRTYLRATESFAPHNTNWVVLQVSFIISTIFQLIGLAVLLLVLRRQGRGLRDLSRSFRWQDVPVSLLLAAAAMTSTYLLRLALFFGGYLMTGRVPDVAAKNTYFLHAGVSFWLLLYTCVNCFHEELIARAYAITEVEYLAGSTLTAAIFSILLQTSYHLYQGLPSALSLSLTFAVFTLYYVKRRRAMPLVLAHLYLDLLSILAYARR